MRHDLEGERFYLHRAYAEAVAAAGGAPLHIPLIPQEESIAALVEKVDGILLPGSASDVDPLLFGQEPHARLGSVHPLRDATDRLVLAAAERSGLPLLAICFGLQIWNVTRGGTLIQDIESQVEGAIKHQQGAPRGRRSHRIRLLPGSLLAELAGGESALVNSHHHQAIETLGHDLRATAWTADGLVEAVEDERAERFAVGTQWHPEIEWAEDDFAQGLFARFVGAAQTYARARHEPATEARV